MLPDLPEEIRSPVKALLKQRGLLNEERAEAGDNPPRDEED